MKYLPNTKLTKYCLLIGLIIGLCSCGFQPRSSNYLTKNVQRLYISTPNSNDPLIIRLSSVLTQAGIKLVSSPKKSQLVLNMTESRIIFNNASVGQSSQVLPANFIMNVNLSVTSSRHKILLTNRQIAYTQTITLNPGETIETSSQLSQLKINAYHALVSQIINILGSKDLRSNSAKKTKRR